VTSFSEEGYEQYGHRFVRSFVKFWHDTRLICYWEGKCPPDVREGWNLPLLEPCRGFLARHADDPVVSGRQEDAGSPWGPKARKQGYSFRHDAYKFARKVFAIAHCARQLETGKLFWIDADVVTNRHVNAKLLEEVLPDWASMCYLPRARYHSEMGFVGYNLNRRETHVFLKAYESQYASDAFLRDGAWDDCHQFDFLVEKFRPTCKEIYHNDRAHPFEASMLGSFMTHFKGPRKFGKIA